MLLRLESHDRGNGIFEHRLFARNRNRATAASATIEILYENPPNPPIARKELKRLAPTEEKLIVVRYGPVESRLSGAIVDEEIEGSRGF